MSAQKLGAVGLVLLGVWWVLTGIEHIATFLDFKRQSGEELDRELAMQLAFIVVPLVLGAFLMWRGPRIARRCMPVDEIRHGPGLEQLLPGAIAALAVFLVLDRTHYVLRLVLPFLWAEEDRLAGMLVPWIEFATIGVAALAFWFSHDIARWWARRDPDATRP